MKRTIQSIALILLINMTGLQSFSQKTQVYDLPARVRHHLLEPAKTGNTIAVLDTASAAAVSCQGLFWLTGAGFSEGTIEVDLRGKNILLKSFLGIAFHGVDSTTYDVVYFRPFNFRHQDTARHNWGVQYMSLPNFPFDKLRKEHPLEYEHAVNPVPSPDDWFHASIVVNRDSILVYVNHATDYCLKVPVLSARHSGKVGIWADELPEDFANLSITENK
ncbi:MAG TPA: hypothetical protein VGI38_08890 [Puia sp.]|jgi:hypothetical protein